MQSHILLPQIFYHNLYTMYAVKTGKLYNLHIIIKAPIVVTLESIIDIS